MAVFFSYPNLPFIFCNPVSLRVSVEVVYKVVKDISMVSWKYSFHWERKMVFNGPFIDLNI